MLFNITWSIIWKLFSVVLVTLNVLFPKNTIEPSTHKHQFICNGGGTECKVYLNHNYLTLINQRQRTLAHRFIYIRETKEWHTYTSIISDHMVT